MGGSCCSASKSQVNQPTMIKKTQNSQVSEYDQEKLLEQDNLDHKMANIGQYFFEYFQNDTEKPSNRAQNDQKSPEEIKQTQNLEALRIKDAWERNMAKQYDKFKKNKQNKNTPKILTQKNTNYFFIGQEKQMLCFKNLDSQLFITMLRNNPPHCFRWAAWKCKMHNESIYDPQLYDQLQKQKNRYEYDIEKDVHRSFPEHPYFKRDSPTSYNNGQDQLFRVLKAISNYFPKLGYTQGMNFIVGFSLMINGGKEEDSFWLFVNMATDPEYLTLGFFQDQFPHLHFLIFAFKKVFEQKLPKLYKHFDDMGLPDQIWIWKWLLTSFLYSFPLDVCARLWDFIISSGIQSLISLSLAITEQYQEKLMNLDFAELSLFFSDLKDSNYRMKDEESEIFLDLEKIFCEAKKIKITRKQLENYANDYAKQEHVFPVNKDNRYLKFYLLFNQNYKKAIQNYRQDMKDNGEIIDVQQLYSNLQQSSNIQCNEASTMLLESSELKSNMRKDSCVNEEKEKEKQQQQSKGLEDIQEIQNESIVQKNENLEEIQNNDKNIELKNSKSCEKQGGDIDLGKVKVQNSEKNIDLGTVQQNNNNSAVVGEQPVLLYQFSSDSIKGKELTLQQTDQKKELSMIESNSNEIENSQKDFDGMKISQIMDNNDEINQNQQNNTNNNNNDIQLRENINVQNLSHKNSQKLSKKNSLEKENGGSVVGNKENEMKSKSFNLYDKKGTGLGLQQKSLSEIPVQQQLQVQV